MIRVLADENIPYVKEVFAHFGEVRTLPGRAINPATLENAQCLLVRSITKVDQALLQGSKVKFVATATIGTDHVDTESLNKKGITFASAPGSNAISVAEYIVSVLLNLSREFKFPLSSKSVGIVGVGNVGSRVAARLSALGMKVVLNDPPLAEKTSDPKYRPIEEVLGCDIITLHTPLTKDGPCPTRHLVNRPLLQKTRKGLILINSSRGGVADSDAISEFMDQGHFTACVFDVWENEPSIRASLFERSFLGTPHIAGYSFDGKVRGTEMIYRAAADHFKIKSQWRLSLPVPTVPEITLPRRYESIEEVLSAAVLPVYDVRRDDARMRPLIGLPQPEQGPFFDQLRKSYPVRREFANTRVFLRTKDPALLAMLKALEFIVENQ